MPSKQMKCCCVKPCQGQCVNIGSIFSQCTVCSESPLLWNIEDFFGTSADNNFNCCPALKNVYTFGMLYGIPSTGTGSAGCVWTTPNTTTTGHGFVSCGGGVTAQWVLSIGGINPKQVTLTAFFSDGREIIYTNLDPWNCLCSNLMTLFHTVGNMTGCNPKRTLCLGPVPPCCAGRTSPLPRSLHVQLTPISGCDCVAGALFTIDWNPHTGRWEGSGSFGSCAADLGIKLFCSSPPDFSTIWGGTFNFFNTSGINGCVPMTDALFNGVFNVHTQCDPVHISWQRPFTFGCCVTTTSLVQFDIVEF